MSPPPADATTLTPGQKALHEILGSHSMIKSPDIDLEALVSARLDRLRQTMAEHGLDLLLLTNPVNMRYATDYRGYALFQGHIPTSAVLVAVAGPTLLLGADTDQHSFVDQVVPALPLTGFDSGLDTEAMAYRLADFLKSYLVGHGLPCDAAIGIERTTPVGFRALTAAGLTVIDAEATIELARSRKHRLELEPMLHSIEVAQFAIAQMQEALVPGITENQLWSILHQVNIAHNGDWVDGRMLASGPRSNPWLQEASGRVINKGEIVAFDTDMIGPFGYCADISRTFVCGDQPATPAQKDLYRMAVAEIEHNTHLLGVGASFAELSHNSFSQPAQVAVNRYPCVFHGVGMSDEYPKIPYPQDWDAYGYDGEIEDGMMICVESYVGPDGGDEGVKLEQMVQVNSDGVQALSTFPLWEL